MEKLEKVLRKLNREIENMYNDGTLEIDQYNLLTDEVNKALVLFCVGIMFKDKQINRFEVIDKIGRAYVNVCDRPLKIEASLQDDDRTLKIFLDD